MARLGCSEAPNETQKSLETKKLTLKQSIGEESPRKAANRRPTDKEKDPPKLESQRQVAELTIVDPPETYPEEKEDTREARVVRSIVTLALAFLQQKNVQFI